MREPIQTWPLLRQVERQALRLDDVMHGLDIEPVTAARLGAGEALLKARRVCLECPFERKCERWLDASIVLEAPPLFCPNTAFLARCQAAH